jgi:hypothetical protein
MINLFTRVSGEPGPGHLPYIPRVYEDAQRQYREQAEAGLNEESINEMYSSSGQIKPEYENDPRILAYIASQTEKDHDGAATPAFYHHWHDEDGDDSCPACDQQPPAVRAMIQQANE